MCLRAGWWFVVSSGCACMHVRGRDRREEGNTFGLSKGCWSAQRAGLHSALAAQVAAQTTCA